MIARLLALFLLVLPAGAAEDPVAEAIRAAAMVSAAADQLAKAGTDRNRLAGYGAAVLAYETGLDAVRDGLRGLAGRRAALQADLDARRDLLSGVLGMLQVVETTPAPVQLLHPEGPLGSARAAFLMAEVSPALDAELIRLQALLAEMQAISAEQTRARDVLRDGLAAAQGARVVLAEALARESHAPAPGAEAIAVLRESSVSLRAFADALSTAPGQPATETEFSAARGFLPLPVAGKLRRRYGEADAAGIIRPGLVLEGAPQSLVTSPWRATLRYAGDFLDYGQMVILEPESGYLLIFAGLGQVHRATGEVVEPGEPLGTLGGTQPETEEFLIDQTQGPRETVRETLYMELRKDGEPVDPTSWFRFGPEQEGQQ